MLSLTNYIKLIVSVSWLSLSCNQAGSQDHVSDPKGYDQVEIIINSPYSCFNEIRFDTAGTGTNIWGFRRTHHADEIKSKKRLMVNWEVDRKKIRELIGKIEKRAPVSSARMEDAYQFILKVDNKEFVNVYGEDSLMNQLFVVMVPYIENKENGQCDFFHLFNQNLQKRKRPEAGE